MNWIFLFYTIEGIWTTTGWWTRLSPLGSSLVRAAFKKRQKKVQTYFLKVATYLEREESKQQFNMGNIWRVSEYNMSKSESLFS